MLNLLKLLRKAFSQNRTKFFLIGEELMDFSFPFKVGNCLTGFDFLKEDRVDEYQKTGNFWF